MRDFLKIRANELVWNAIDWFYPPTCGSCGEFGVRWCAGCQSKTVIIDDRICPVCGIPQPERRICQKCQSRPPLFTEIRSWAVYEGMLREAIHSFKFNKNMGLGTVFASFLLDVVKTTHWPIDLVIAVPLSPKRMRERGYNQSNLLARPVAWALGIPFSTKALIRTRQTRSQVGLRAHERIKNVQGAFLARRKVVSGRNILIIDDITTTGSTISACAQALHEAGGNDVFGLTLARAVVNSNSEPELLENS